MNNCQQYSHNYPHQFFDVVSPAMTKLKVNGEYEGQC